ncbi:hypothetical protein E2562_031160 [Oryza meyeriana var. granulata]|uniref:Uncharacterized protein n=1 Tax=Oryza meyeriana var. granulata TaxID=110450 RepID=A0A6G1EC01_9ORYZ|nr:hypothetical protein E2562_031160 [Oryza meyeriana var. granulata]
MALSVPFSPRSPSRFALLKASILPNKASDETISSLAAELESPSSSLDSLRAAGEAQPGQPDSHRGGRGALLRLS